MEPVEFKFKMLASFSFFNIDRTNRLSENYAACKCSIQGKLSKETTKSCKPMCNASFFIPRGCCHYKVNCRLIFPRTLSAACCQSPQIVKCSKSEVKTADKYLKKKRRKKYSINWQTLIKQILKDIHFLLFSCCSCLYINPAFTVKSIFLDFWDYTSLIKSLHIQFPLKTTTPDLQQCQTVDNE